MSLEHSEQVLVTLALVFVLGMSAQWLAWAWRIPSIVLLLLFGFLAGPVSGQLDPDELFGELLQPVVSLSVALILFEGGLTLRLSEFREISGMLVRLMTIGVLATWVLIAAAAHWMLSLPASAAVLLGAILVVTGPTVIGPLLRHVRPSGRVGAIAKWEGIVVDPIGAVLAVLVLQTVEAVHSGSVQNAAWAAAGGLLKSAAAGVGVGLLFTFPVVALMRRYLIPDMLQSPVLLMMVVAAFTASNLIEHESGLLAVTVMGVVLTNIKSIDVSRIIEFKENLRVLLISSLFIVLAARVDLTLLQQMGWGAAGFVLFLMLVVRPLAVLLSSIGTDLAWKERLFLSWLAPRGIVAASVASVLAIGLGPAGDALVPATFLVIASTVVVYGFTLGPLAYRLGLATPNPQGFLIAGAHRLAREVAKALKNAGYDVLLIDTNRHNIRSARLEGLRAQFANILSDHVFDDMDLGGIGRFLAMTPNDEVNSLASLHFSEVFGKAEVYQLTFKEANVSNVNPSAKHMHGRFLFDQEATCTRLSRRVQDGAVIKQTKLTEEFSLESYHKVHGDSALPMFLIADSGNVSVASVDSPLKPRSGQILVSLVDPVDDARQANREPQEQQ